jgi:tripartite-type tricarboxylate transporter receptor subunit TctC
MAFGSPPATMPLIEGGKLRALAVTSAKRLPILANIPTIGESGVPGYDETAWIGYAVPSGTPTSIVKRLHEAFRSAMLAPEYRRFTERNGAELIASTQEYAASLIRSDYERLGKIVKDLDLKVE